MQKNQRRRKILLSLAINKRTFTYRCKPWAQHKPIFEYEKGFWNPTLPEPHTVVSPWLTERQRRKARTGRKLRVTSTFASLRSHLATPSWAGKNLLCDVHVTLLAFQMKQPACHLGGELRLPRRHRSSTELFLVLSSRPVLRLFQGTLKKRHCQSHCKGRRTHTRSFPWLLLKVQASKALHHSLGFLPKPHSIWQSLTQISHRSASRCHYGRRSQLPFDSNSLSSNSNCRLRLVCLLITSRILTILTILSHIIRTLKRIIRQGILAKTPTVFIANNSWVVLLLCGVLLLRFGKIYVLL